MIFLQDPRLTFDTFASGPDNRMAVAAARRVAENPRTAVNPLFIYGPSGAGKTHLLHAVGALALAVRPDLRVLFTTADMLVDRVSAAVADGSIEHLRDELLEADLVLLDEAHLLAGRARTQEELLSLWDELESRAQLVTAAEGPSPELPGVDEGLRSRFVRGLVVDLPPASDDARGEIARKAAELRGIDLEDAAAEHIARMPLTDAAGVVAAVERVGAAQAERGAPLSADEVAEVVSHAPPLAAPHPDEFGAFLTDIASTLEEIVEAAPWRRKVAEAILRWEGEGIRTRRLEQALEADSAPDVDTLLAGFSDDVRRLQRIRDEMEEMGSDLARSPVLADPDRAAEAEALLVSARAARERRVEEAVRSAPQVDRWFFNAEKLAWSWLALDDRLLEELS